MLSLKPLALAIQIKSFNHFCLDIFSHSDFTKHAICLRSHILGGYGSQRQPGNKNFQSKSKMTVYTFLKKSRIGS